VKTGLSGADILISASDTLEDLRCNDYVCASLDIIDNIVKAVGLKKQQNLKVSTLYFS